MRLFTLFGLFGLIATFPALADVDMFRMPSGNVECTIGSGRPLPTSAA